MQGTDGLTDSHIFSSDSGISSHSFGRSYSIMNKEGPPMADPCSEKQMTSNNKKIDDIGMNNWLEL